MSITPEEHQDMAGQTFHGNSTEGDFQAALADAINNASAVLAANIADGRIAWRLCEISGRSGGIVGERTMTVAIEAQLN